jgi:DNA-binding response OmpR family regulator
MPRILAIDDDGPILELLRSLLTLEGFEVETACDGRDGIGRFEADPHDLVVTDLMMPEQEGIETIRRLRAIDREVPILVISGESARMPGSCLKAALHLGANRALAKPFANRELIAAVRELLDGKPA